MNNKLDFTFTNAISLGRPQRRTSPITTRRVIIAGLLLTLSVFAYARWEPMLLNVLPITQNETNPLYDEH